MFCLMEKIPSDEVKTKPMRTLSNVNKKNIRFNLPNPRSQISNLLLLVNFPGLKSKKYCIITSKIKFRRGNEKLVAKIRS